MSQDSKKKVDQDWKDQVDKEKGTAQDKNEAYHQPTFTVFISSLGMQAMIAMGKLDNPMTKKREKSYDQARFLIDTLVVIQEKTKGNLDQEEDKALQEYLFNLRMMYVEEKRNG